MNITNSTDGGVATRNVTFEPISLSDNDGSVPTLTSDYASGSLFPIGLTEVTLNATDTANNIKMCTFTINITGKHIILGIFYLTFKPSVHFW